MIKSRFDEKTKSKNEKEFAIVTEISPVAAENVLAFFASEGGKQILQRMKQVGIHPKSEKISREKAAELPFAGKTFVLTGNLPSMTLEEASAKIETHGDHVISNDTKKTE